MDQVRRWFLLGGSILAVAFGAGFGVVFMGWTVNVFDTAVARAGSDAFLLVHNLAQGVKGVLGWVVFGITMTNAMIISSTLSVVMMLQNRK